MHALSCGQRLRGTQKPTRVLADNDMGAVVRCVRAAIIVSWPSYDFQASTDTTCDASERAHMHPG